MIKLLLVTLFATALAQENGVTGQNEELKVEIGKSANFHCPNEGKKCMLMYNNSIVAPEDMSERGNIVADNLIQGQTDCDFELKNVQTDFQGIYNCYPPKKIDLIVMEKPGDLQMFHDSKPVRPDSRHVLLSRDDADIECKITAGSPHAVIRWTVADSERQPLNTYYNDTTKEVVSILRYTFPENRQDKEERVECTAVHELFEPYGFVKVGATFGEAVPITRVELNYDNLFIGPNDERKVHCIANGMPEPEIIIIEQKESNGWIERIRAANYTVTTPGFYRCKAKNMLNVDFINSTEIEFTSQTPPKASQAETADVGAIVGGVVGVLVLLIIIIAVVAVLHRSQRACFKRQDRNSQGSVENGGKGFDGGVDNPNREHPRSDNPKEGVTPATNHQ